MKSQASKWLTWMGASIALPAALLFWNVGAAVADPVLPGFDYRHTTSGGVIINPADFGFGGPNVFVPLQGQPLGPSYSGPGALPNLGNTDTIVQRLPVPPLPLPPGGTGLIDIEIVALSLQSVAPIPLGTSFFDVFVELRPSPPSLGKINVTSHVDPPGAGTLDSFFDVFYEIKLTDVNTTASLPPVPGQDHLLQQPPISTWTHAAPPLYPGQPGFVPGPVTHAGARLTISTDPASVPELSGVWLLGVVGVGVGAIDRFRRWRAVNDG